MIYCDPLSIVHFLKLLSYLCSSSDFASFASDFVVELITKYTASSHLPQHTNMELVLCSQIRTIVFE